jgi:hypothetical protein
MLAFEDKDIANRWAAQYQRGKRWKYCHGDKTSKQIHAELDAVMGRALSGQLIWLSSDR